MKQENARLPGEARGFVLLEPAWITGAAGCMRRTPPAGLSEQAGVERNPACGAASTVITSAA
jgi:hypothetical protein